MHNRAVTQSFQPFPGMTLISHPVEIFHNRRDTDVSRFISIDVLMPHPHRLVAINRHVPIKRLRRQAMHIDPAQKPPQHHHADVNRPLCIAAIIGHQRLIEFREHVIVDLDSITLKLL